MLSKILKPVEVKNTIAEIDTFLTQHTLLCRDIVSADAIRLARITDKTVHSIRNDGLKPDQLALILITNVIGFHLSSGQYHTYRGVLGSVGADMLKLWAAAISTLQQRGYYSAEEAEEDMRWIQSEIAGVG